MSVIPLVILNNDIGFSGSAYILLSVKRIVYYHAYQYIDVELTGDYETDRELIFGRGGFIKDSPLVKAVMIICGYENVRYYITENEIYYGKPVSIYNGENGRYMFIEVLSALMARITNYFQAIQGLWNEDPDTIKQDIAYIIEEMIYNLAKQQYNVIFHIYLYDSPPSYEVLVEIGEKQ